MLELIKENWEQLYSEYCDSLEVMNLLKEISVHPNKDLVDEVLNNICRADVYHRSTDDYPGIIDEVTFAAIPYMLELAKTDFTFDIVLNIAVTLVDAYSEEVENLFASSKLSKEILSILKKGTIKAFTDLADIIFSLTDRVKEQDEPTKRYFLAAFSLINKKQKLAHVFITFSDNEEYVCYCPQCDSEYVLENKEDMCLIDIEQGENLITPQISYNKKEKAELRNDFEWLSFYIDEFDISSLKNIINYLFGEITCNECGHTFVVFKALNND